MAVASNDLFINLIQNNPIIYDKKSKDFKNTLKKDRVWNKIAQESFMTVEDAKKRYASFRQKYSREKNNIEIRRRLKQPSTKSWSYYDRLSFLNPYIQSRTTYTNDVHFNSGSHDPQNNISSLDDGLNNDFDTLPNEELARETVEDEEVPRETNENEEVHCERNEDNLAYFNVDDIPIAILSEYSGEITEFHPFNGTMQYSVQNEEMITDSEIFGESVDGELANTTSQNPSTNKDQRQDMNVSQQNDGPGVESSFLEDSVGVNVNLVQETSASMPRMLNFPRVSNNASSTMVAPPAPPLSIRPTPPPSIRPTPPSLIRPTPPSLTICPATPSVTHPASNAASRPAPNSTSRPASNAASRPAPNSTSRPASNAASRPAPNSTSRPASNSAFRQAQFSASHPLPHNTTATSSKDNTAIDAIRNKMNSCLQAISTKVAEKSNRSPHAPFLAYLDTKLALVPKEHLPHLEKEILNLTETYQE